MKELYFYFHCVRTTLIKQNHLIMRFSRFEYFPEARSKEITAFLDTLKKESWLGQTRSWWPNYLFRFDNILSAAAILNSGRLLSRNSAIDQKEMVSDSASRGVIAITPDEYKSYARLYFRPLTPTQFCAEGIRTADKVTLEAHCPVPVVMLYDAKDILTRADTIFSDGNLAKSGVKTGDTAKFLKSIPFDKVYHIGPFDSSERDTIVFHRHAEIIVPNELDLTPLRFIICRSQAEYETLLFLLESNIRKNGQILLVLNLIYITDVGHLWKRLL